MGKMDCERNALVKAVDSALEEVEQRTAEMQVAAGRPISRSLGLREERHGAGPVGVLCRVPRRHDRNNPLFTRYTFSLVWPASATANRQGSALARAVQPLDAWR